uniref:Uncharacterized protein n=1 Tax=Ditylenchus dipsaci TaxID=166011 RepID=A0A915E9E2_9BILA
MNRQISPETMQNQSNRIEVDCSPSANQHHRLEEMGIKNDNNNSLCAEIHGGNNNQQQQHQLTSSPQHQQQLQLNAAAATALSVAAAMEEQHLFGAASMLSSNGVAASGTSPSHSQATSVISAVGHPYHQYPATAFSHFYSANSMNMDLSSGISPAAFSINNLMDSRQLIDYYNHTNSLYSGAGHASVPQQQQQQNGGMNSQLGGATPDYSAYQHTLYSSNNPNSAANL